MAEKPKRPRDVSQRAKLIVDFAPGDQEDDVLEKERTPQHVEEESRQIPEKDC